MLDNCIVPYTSSFCSSFWQTMGLGRFGSTIEASTSTNQYCTCILEAVVCTQLPEQILTG